MKITNHDGIADTIEFQLAALQKLGRNRDETTQIGSVSSAIFRDKNFSHRFDVSFAAPLAVLDLETTGLHPEKDRVVEIGLVLLAADCAIQGEFSTLLKIDRDLGAHFVHRITDASIGNAPRFSQIAAPLSRLLAGRIIVAHNARFDVGFLNMEFVRAAHQFRVNLSETICTLDQSRIFCTPGSHSLQQLIARIGLPQRQAHCALDDARSASDLLLYFVKNELAGIRQTQMARSHSGEKVFPSMYITEACAPKLR
ncbi:3'-5' exonuclease [Arcanobacterium hippocoleae]|uniref:3'-5' exonuclease n=1 Tax=Arcanobacterium hippocoleae TaxID=149017 RepID=UPI00333F8BE5